MAGLGGEEARRQGLEAGRGGGGGRCGFGADDLVVRGRGEGAVVDAGGGFVAGEEGQCEGVGFGIGGGFLRGGILEGLRNALVYVEAVLLLDRGVYADALDAVDLCSPLRRRRPSVRAGVPMPGRDGQQ